MAIAPNHPIWKRMRKPHHGGAMRELSLPDGNSICLSPRGPGASPLYCRNCEEDKNNNLNSGSSGYFSSTNVAVHNGKANIMDCEFYHNFWKKTTE